MRLLLIGAMCCTFIAASSPARALEGRACTTGSDPAPFEVTFDGAPSGHRDGAISQRPWLRAFDADDAGVPALASAVSLRGAAALVQDAPYARPRAVQMSRAYEVRMKIHRLASWATVPLFVAQYVAGQKLHDGDYTGEGTKDLHSALATGTTVLFGVNTVTGVWNLWDARKKPEGRTRRIIHSILMLGADAGFVATGMMAPDDDDDGEGEGEGNRSGHRNVAIASMSVATASYLYMLFTR